MACICVVLAVFTPAPHLAAAPAATPNPANPSPGTQTPADVRDRGSVTGRVQNVVTGQYLNQARVAVKGTDDIALTDPFGTYHLVNVPGGPIVLEVFYTDLDVQEIRVEIPAGGTVEQHVHLTSAARYGRNAAVVRLDPFTVAADKETNAQAIAINEQRFAANIKNVVSTDSLGNILGNNAGEFLKYLPGVTGEYAQLDIASVSLRGIGGGMTSFTSNGDPMASAWTAGMGRSFNPQTMTFQDVSRVEVTKVPTPSNAADSLAGSINLVSKSAFERARSELRYGINLVGNGENLTLGKTPYSVGDKNTYKTHLGGDFDFTWLVNKRFGLVLAGLHSDKYNEQHLSNMVWNNGGTGTGASIGRPYLQQHTLQDGPQNKARTTVSLKADFRVTPHSVLSLKTSGNMFFSTTGTLSWATNAGTNATPTPAAGTPFSYGENFTNGATGRGAVTMSTSATWREVTGTTSSLSYRLDDGTWRIEASLSSSVSRSEMLNRQNGQFNGFSAEMMNPVRVVFSDINPTRPGRIQVLDNSNREVDIYDIRNYRATTASGAPTSGADYDITDEFQSGNLSVRRELDFMPFPAALQLGGQQRIRTNDTRTDSPNWTFNGPDGNPATPEPPPPNTMMQVYVNQDSHYGFRNVPWISPSRAFAAHQANPALFSQTAAQRVAQETGRINNSERIRETVSALYLQADARFFQSRLKVLTGVRHEKTAGDGVGALSEPNTVFVRNPNGTIAKDGAGNSIRRPEAGAAGSMEQLRLTLKERAARSRRTYDGYYPSLHLTFDLRENFIARAAYARTYGRPNFSDIIPRTVVNERDLTQDQLEDPNVIKGTITVRNAGLRPWTADNFDLSLEYYTKQGGLFSAGVFRKEIRNFFGDAVRVATLSDLQEVGIDDPRYGGWNLATKFNAGSARISGADFNIRHSLRELGPWGAYFSVFANGTYLKLEGNQQASFSSFIPKSANWGFSFSRKRLSVVAMWNHRGLNQRGAQPAFGPDGFEYFDSVTKLDLSLAFQVSRRVSVVSSINNVFNQSTELMQYGSQTPPYARQRRTEEFGAGFSIGIKGSF
ncbi:MAG: TonB-dependent receptor [Verrucomicrobia bacterium]|nr:TonB-dependent receptor [Verrucomicrobiota bacterium]